MTLKFEQLRRCSFAVDLGTVRTRVYLKGTGLIVDEPTVAAVNIRTGGLIAVGSSAEEMTGRTPGHIRVVRPVNDGTIVDIAMAQRMLRSLLAKTLRRSWRLRPLMSAAACVPHNAEPLACRAAIETLTGVGARRVELVDSLLAAAAGCGLPVERPEASMIVLCGTADTQVAVLSLGEVVATQRVPVGGDTIDHVVAQHVRSEHELVLPGQTERPLHLILSRTGAAANGAEVRGRDVATGCIRSVRLDAEGVRAAINGPLTGVLDAIGGVLRRCPPDLVADLVDRGIMLAGNSARLPGLDTMLREATGMRVSIAEHPEVCAVEGLKAMLEGRVQPMFLDPLAS